MSLPQQKPSHSALGELEGSRDSAPMLAISIRQDQGEGHQLASPGSFQRKFTLLGISCLNRVIDKDVRGKSSKIKGRNENCQGKKTMKEQKHKP